MSSCSEDGTGAEHDILCVAWLNMACWGWMPCCLLTAVACCNYLETAVCVMTEWDTVLDTVGFE